MKQKYNYRYCESPEQFVFFDKLFRAKIHTKYPTLFLKFVRCRFSDTQNRLMLDETDNHFIKLTQKEYEILEQQKIYLNPDVIDNSSLPDSRRQAAISWFFENKSVKQMKEISILSFKALKKNMNELAFNLYELTEKNIKHSIYDNILNNLKNSSLLVPALEACFIVNLFDASLMMNNLCQLQSIFKKLTDHNVNEIEFDINSDIFNLIFKINTQIKHVETLLLDENDNVALRYPDVLFPKEKINSLSYMTTMVSKFYIQMLSTNYQVTLFGYNHDAIEMFEFRFKNFIHRYTS